MVGQRNGRSGPPHPLPAPPNLGADAPALTFLSESPAVLKEASKCQALIER